MRMGSSLIPQFSCALFVAEEMRRTAKGIMMRFLREYISIPDGRDVRGLADLYVLCKGGLGEVGGHSFLLPDDEMNSWWVTGCLGPMGSVLGLRFLVPCGA
jgi:hypothetical protein